MKSSYYKGNEVALLHLNQKDIVKFMYDKTDDKKTLNRHEKRILKALIRKNKG